MLDAAEGEAVEVAERGERKTRREDEEDGEEGCRRRHFQSARENGPSSENIEQKDGQQVVDQRQACAVHVEGKTHHADAQRAERHEETQAVSFRAAEAQPQSQQSGADEGECAKGVEGFLPLTERDALAVQTETSYFAGSQKL